MEPIKSLGEKGTQSNTLLTRLPTALQGKESYVLAGAGHRKFWGPWEKWNLSKFIGIAGSLIVIFELFS